MSIRDIQILSLNPHFIARLIQSFLTGYEEPCTLERVFYVSPILFYKGSRLKLSNARMDSKMETIFETFEETERGSKLSGKVRLSGFIERYESMKEYGKQALIILYSEDAIIYNNKIEIVNKIDFKKYKGEIRSWLKASYYLGVIMRKATETQINYYFGIEE